MQTAPATAPAKNSATTTSAPKSIFSHLLTLAAIRRLELAQAIRMARMQGATRAVQDLEAERATNDAAIAHLQRARPSVAA